MPPKTRPATKPERNQINLSIGADDRIALEQLCDDESERTGQDRSRIQSPLIRRLIREEYRRRFPAAK